MNTLKDAISGQTIYIPFSAIGTNYNNQTGFPSEADLQAWCTVYNLQYETTTINNETTYKISPIQ
jgi:hypothetical protein